MARPTKPRRVHNLPEASLFKPAGVPGREMEEVTLAVEELEALRLKDLEGLDQAECAEIMEVSRPTFQRILGSARQKVATALVEAKALRIEGGSYQVATRRMHCPDCGEMVEVPAHRRGRRRHGRCPHCSGPVEG
ncbi:MAG: DUF134 domain-containing protein [Firmicutes bacterium]|nr:DUF134 domain-containing protein [Bacillota bacterium]